MFSFVVTRHLVPFAIASSLFVTRTLWPGVAFAQTTSTDADPSAQHMNIWDAAQNQKKQIDAQIQEALERGRTARETLRDIERELKAARQRVLWKRQLDAVRETRDWAESIVDATLASIQEVLAWLPEFDLVRQAATEVSSTKNDLLTKADAFPQLDPAVAAEARKEIDAIAERLEATLAQFKEQYAVAISKLKDRLSRPTALIVSGGVSLGSYQAGLLHYYSQFLLAHKKFLKEHLKLNNELPSWGGGSFRVSTGASAGSMNSFLSVIAGCREPVTNPEESLFYKAWIPVGMNELLDLESIEVDGILSRAPIEKRVDEITALWKTPEGWSKEPCDAYLGMSVTRLEARSIPVQYDRDSATKQRPILSGHRQSEKFLLHVTGKGGETPKFFPFRPIPKDGNELAVHQFYPILGSSSLDSEVALGDVFDLLLASSSFPLAFPPITLPYRTVNQRGDLEVEVERAEFVDGGIFDNTPLRLAIRMNHWLGNAAKEEHLAPWYVFVEPDALGWKTTTQQREEEKLEARRGPDPDDAEPPATIFHQYLPFVASFIQSSREAELLDSIEDDPSVRERLEMPTRTMPVASSQLRNFMGFLEKDFRRFDFYVGMADAWNHLRKFSDQYRFMRDAGVAVTVDQGMFQCMIEFYQRAEAEVDLNKIQISDLPACARENAENANLVKLLAVSRDMKVYSTSDKYKKSRELKKFLERLKAHEYEFKDLKHRGSPADADSAVYAIREVMQDVMHVLGEQQHGAMASGAVWVAGKAAANYFEYRSPQFMLFVGAHFNRGLELGLAQGLGNWGLRLVLGTRLFQFRRVVLESEAAAERRYQAMPAGTSADNRDPRGLYLGGIMPMGRLEYEYPWFTNLQVALGLGWAANFVEKTYPLPIQHVMIRHGPEAKIGITLLQRVYLNVAATYYVDSCARTNNGCGHLSDDFRGFLTSYYSSPIEDLAPIVTHRAEWHVTLGWRSLLD